MATGTVTLTHKCGLRITAQPDVLLTGAKVWCPKCRTHNPLLVTEFTISVSPERQDIAPDKADEIIRLISGACQSRGIEPMVLLNMILQLTKSVGAALGSDEGAPIPWITSLHEAACRLVLADPGTERR
jgi:hypothetical protein